MIFTATLARRTILTSAILVLRVGFQAAHLILLARLVGPQLFGVIAAMTAFGVLWGALVCAGSQYVTLEVVSREPERTREKALFQWATPLLLLFGSLSIVAYVPLCLWLFRGEADNLWLFASAVAISEFVISPFLVLVSMAQLARDRTAFSQVIRISPLALRATGTLMIILLVASEALIFVFYAACYLLAPVLALGMLMASRVWVPPSITNWKFPSSEEKRMMLGYAPIGITAAGPSEVDKIMAPKLLDLDTAGAFSAAGRVASAITLPVTAMMLALLPSLFRLGRNQVDDTRHPYAAVLSISVAGLGSSALATGLWMTIPYVQTLFGASFDQLSTMLYLFCFVIPGMAMRIVVTNTFLSSSKPYYRISVELLHVITLLAVSLILAKLWDSGLSLILAVGVAEYSIAIIGFGYFLYRLVATRPISHTT